MREPKTLIFEGVSAMILVQKLLLIPIISSSFHIRMLLITMYYQQQQFRNRI
jgi:hypothetical protein